MGAFALPLAGGADAGRASALTRDDWESLNATGLTHLAVVSGLHVGLIASLVLVVALASCAVFVLPTGVSASLPGGWRVWRPGVSRYWRGWHRRRCERR
ncbi:ComEC/Rec2 family competence protein [Cobetia marina]